MATLNDLRTKGGVIVTIVIAIGLIAFLLGDLFSSGSIFSSSQDTVVGKINGEEIEYLDFMEKYEQVKAVYGGSASAEAQDMFNEMVWSDIILEKAYLPSLEEMGLTVTEAELLDMIQGTYPSFYLLGQFQYSPEMLRAFMAEAESNPELEYMWNYLQDQTVKDRVMSNYTALLSAGMGVNSLEVSDAVKSASIVSDAKVLSKPYSSIPDSLVAEPTSAAIKKYYDAHKTLYVQPVSRAVEYVEFAIEPSAEDRAAAEAEVNEMVEEFKATVYPMQYASYSTHGQVDTTYYAASEIAPEYKEYAFGKKKGEVYGPVLNGDTYTFARFADERTVTENGKKVKEVQMATVTYNVVAGDATIQQAESDANAFASAAKKSGFRGAVAEQGFNVYNAIIGKNDRNVNALRDARDLVRWTYNNGKGSVSNVMRIDGNFVVATISKISSEYKSLDEVSATIARTLRNEAKAEWVAAQIADATTIEEAAKILGVQVLNVKDLAGDATAILGVGPEAKLVGAITAAEQGEIVAPVMGSFGSIYAFIVTDRTENADVKVDDIKVALDADLEAHFVPANVSDAIMSGIEVEDNRIKFF